MDEKAIIFGVGFGWYYLSHRIRIDVRPRTIVRLRLMRREACRRGVIGQFLSGDKVSAGSEIP